MIVALDAEASLDPGRVGAKAVWLARGLRTGLPVLPGLVVEASDSRGHMELGAATLAERGSGGARLAITSTPLPEPDRLIEAARRIGDRLVARSSTSLEASGEWSGAFASYLDVTADELPKAVVGCWSSAFTVSSLAQQEAAGVDPGSFPMAVLVQRLLDPAAGGAAQIEDDGSIQVTGVKGSPAPLLQGWSSGHRARHDGVGWQGEELIDLIGTEALDQIARILRQTSDGLGMTRCEWAIEDRLWVLQLGARSHTPTRAIAGVEMTDPGLIPIARAAALAPGRLGEDLVLPWALAGLPACPTTDLAPTPLHNDQARKIRDRLVAEVWGLPTDLALAEARGCMSTVLGPEPEGALDRIRSLRPPEPTSAWRLLGHVEASLAPRHDSRLGYGRWEPFIAAVALAFGEHHAGTPASPGVGAGRRAHVDRPSGFDAFRPRMVVTARQPLPQHAPLLWDATGLVTATGSPAAHLFESARALGIPAVCGVELGDGDSIVAVDGDNGIVATIEMNGDSNG